MRDTTRIATLLVLCGLTTGYAAPRRQLRLVLVLDRSSSMHPNIAAMRVAASDFVNGFKEGQDRLGLVVFGASAIVAFPPRDPASPEAGSGPAANFKTARPSLPELIQMVQAGSNTGTAEALWLAYRELAKEPVSGALNVIVLFTDGLPNGITAEFNDPDPARNLLRADSTCTHKPPKADGFPMRGVLVQQCGFQLVCRSPRAVTGPLQLMNTTVDRAHPDVASWLRDGPFERVIGPPSSDGCAYQRGGPIARDIREIPEVDLYGNSTAGDGYRESSLYKKQRVPLDRKAVGNAYQIGLASWNAADAAARRIRQDRQLNITVHVVGLGSASELPDDVLLKRIANARTRKNTIYDPKQPTGLCVMASRAAGLEKAFGKVAAQVRRALRSGR